MEKSLIIGLGSVIMGDDGVGVQVIKELQNLKIKGVDLLDGGTSGLSLLPYFQGRKKVIIIDALRGGGEPPGTIYRLKEEDLEQPRFRVFSLHDIALEHVLTLAREMFPDDFPLEVVIYGVEAEVVKLSDQLSGSVKKVIPYLVKLLRKELNLDDFEKINQVNKIVIR